MPVKNLELLLDIAEEQKDLQFDVVGDGNSESNKVRSLRLRAGSLPNVHLHGIIPHRDIHRFYRQAFALICTSHAEGFPNIFLEAWSHGLPVVSTFDPDNIIARNNLGFVAKDAPGLIAGIRRLLDNPAEWQKISQSVREYYLLNHSEETVMDRIEKALMELSSN